MSSLRRILSIDATDSTIPPVQSRKSHLASYRSLPVLSLKNPKGLPSLPNFPTSRLHKGRHGHGISYLDTRCSFPRQFSFSPSAPAWSAEEGLGTGACTMLRPNSGNQSLDIGDSVVYKELVDSIRSLEAPSRHMPMVSSEIMLGSADTQVNGELPQDGSMDMVEPSTTDVRGRPLSLRMLKRKGSRLSGLSVSCTEQDLHRGCSNGEMLRDGMPLDIGASVNSAFSSLVFMMESLQQHTLWLRKVLISEADAHLQVLMSTVHQEMQDTFLWIFQQVFSYTPKLMLLTMILLSDFAVHSMGQHVALGVMPMGEPPTCVVERGNVLNSTLLECLDESGRISGSHGRKTLSIASSMVEPRICEGGAGSKGVRAVKVGGSMDGESMPVISVDQAAMTSKEDAHGGLNDASLCGCYSDGEAFLGTSTVFNNKESVEERHILSAIWQQAASKERSPRPLTQTRHMLVAPIQAPALEADNYPCYDRTDLKYQHELNRDPSNPLLLANYAQFLHVVRHDHDRAEAMYKRAVQADPVDGEVMGKFASFLWVAREDAEAADEAYKAAVAVDPTNAYHAGSYAHFLWNSGSDCEDAASNYTSSYQQVSSS